jgi:hypothetical protein
MTSFNDNTINMRNLVDVAFLLYANTGIVIDNLTILNENFRSVYTNAVTGLQEFTNSSFSLANSLHVSNRGWYISKNHNDVANDYVVSVGTSETANKSTITQDMDVNSNVTLRSGTLIVDEASTHRNLTIDSGTTWDVSANTTHTINDAGTITVNGTLDWVGTAGNLITLVSNNPGTQWSLTDAGTVNVSYVDVTDSDASGGTAIDATDGTSVGVDQNNTNWNWPPTLGGAGVSSAVSVTRRIRGMGL